MEQQAAVSALWRPRFTRFDTSEAPPGERFDSWCALFPLLDMQPMESLETYRSIALSCAGDDGTVISHLQPGPTATDMNPEDGPMAGAMHGLMALVRHAQPEEIAGMVAYLTGPEAAMVTGASLLIDGGFAA